MRLWNDSRYAKKPHKIALRFVSCTSSTGGGREIADKLPTKA
ncbi:hypothetical protein OG890_20155 [Streptomyces anulatus]|nr:hypothetical protein [Streptomyces anulatus]MCX4486242.1 hypothetical protein [Streptomyces anulatus]MCX4508521.1 hypothetical protein [Streptomyces anulatus]